MISNRKGIQMNQKDHEANVEKGTCKYCFGAEVAYEMKSCPLCKEHSPYIPITQAVEMLLKRGYRLYAIRLLTDILEWSISRAKEYCNNLHVKAEVSYAKPIDDLIEELAKGGNPMQAIKIIREQSGWGLKQAREYFELMYYKT